MALRLLLKAGYPASCGTTQFSKEGEVSSRPRAGIHTHGSSCEGAGPSSSPGPFRTVAMLFSVVVAAHRLQ